MKTIELFADGACRGNPGPGGWGVLLRHGDKTRELYGAADHTTNNRMELMAVIEGFRALKADCHVIVTTDSQYVKKGMTEWLQNWKKRGWKNSQRQPVKNVDLWQLLDELVQTHQVEWHWVRGHSGHPENERADALANQAIDEACF